MRVALIALFLLASACGRVGYEDEFPDSLGDGGPGDGGALADADPLAPEILDIQLATGWNHTCAAIEGRTRCWGSGLAGQLGQGEATGSNAPVEVALPAATTALAASRQHTCAVSGGDAYCWGLGIYGKLGNGDENDRLVPTMVTGLPPGQVTHINASRFGTCAVAAGQAYCWGVNNQGQCGVNGNADRLTPVLVTNLPSPVEDLSSADNHNCVVVSGTGYCWGGGDTNELGTEGTGGAQNEAVTVATNLSQLSTGIVHSCGILNGGVQCWGQGTNGELGHGLFSSSVAAVSVQGLESGVTALYVGSGKVATDFIDSTCAIKDGDVYCWGRNDNGQLGNQLTANSATPVVVQGLLGKARKIAGGLGHFCAVTEPNNIQCWGLGTNGQLGAGNNADSLTPVSVPLW